MRIINKYWVMLACGFLGVSCYEDKGNYDYVPVDELFPVAISGLKDEVDVLVGEELKLYLENVMAEDY